MGYQNSTFPLAIYGCLDTASRKLLWLRVWVTNSAPKIIGHWYLEYLYETKAISSMLRLGKGTETGIMATIHTYLWSGHGDMDDPSGSVIYGPSTSNQVCYSQWLFSKIISKLVCDLCTCYFQFALLPILNVCSFRILVTKCVLMIYSY